MLGRWRVYRKYLTFGDSSGRQRSRLQMRRLRTGSFQSDLLLKLLVAAECHAAATGQLLQF